MSTHTQEYRKGQGQGARAGGQCAKDSARARGKKNRPRHRRCSCSAAEGHDFSLADSAQLAQKKKKKGQVRSWGGASRSNPRSAADPLRVSVGPSKAPLAYRPTSFRPSRQGHGSISDRVPTPRGFERVGVTRDHLSTERLDAPYPWGLGRVVALPQPTKRGAPVRALRHAREW